MQVEAATVVTVEEAVAAMVAGMDEQHDALTGLGYLPAGSDQL